MIRIYLKIAARNLSRNKLFTAINILGLAIGIACCLIIMLFVQHELSYDQYNEKADRIVRVVFRGTMNGGGKMSEANVMPPTAQTLKMDYPEVQDATRLLNAGMQRIQRGGQSSMEVSVAFADSNFFQIFTLPLLSGDSKTALIQPDAVIISKNIALKYFSKADPIGKVIKFKGSNTLFKITGVFDKVPDNSHFHFDIFASMAGLPDSKSSSWMTSNYYTYLLLPDGYDYRKLEVKLPQVVKKYMGPQLKQAMGMSLTEFRKKGSDIGLFLQPLKDIHLHSDFTNDLEPGGDRQYIYIFAAIAVFMLLIACINFMNLSTSAASRRAREVGVRKVLGSSKVQLIRQFLVESTMLTVLALLLALIFVHFTLPLFNTLSGKKLMFDILTNPLMVPGLLLFSLLVGLLAGSYPALFLSSFNPVSVIKGEFTTGKKSMGFRTGLVVFQFFISITLIVSTSVVYSQLSYIQNKKLGYNKDQVLVLPEAGLLGKNADVFRQELLQDPRVLKVSTSGYLPAGSSYSNNFFVYADNEASKITKTLRYDVDTQYIPTLGIEMAEGRNFSREFASDSAGAIVNETAVKTLGWEGNAVGHTITNSNNYGEKITYRVIGVVKDFHFKSLHERITPLVMVQGANSGAVIIKVKTRDIPGLLSVIKKQWEKLTIDEPFSYSFLDKRFNETYRFEQKVAEILGIFSGLTIFVACLGLFGLAAFTAEQRTKEIGIRKVLGASVTGIVNLLSKDFLKLVLVANIIAWPLAWWVMNNWLQDFAYRVTISFWMFPFAGMLTVLIAVLTVSFHALKAAIANPVNSLANHN